MANAGAQTTGRAKARGKLPRIVVSEMPFPRADLSASSNAMVTGEMVIAPTAIDNATVTVEAGPYAVANKGSPTAAELGKPTVKAKTDASETDIFRLRRPQK